jgi:hypothetical protein
MSLIQLKYEKDLNTAAIYAHRLHHEYPRNTYYQGQLLTILLHQQRYKEVYELLESMEPQKDPWTDMNRVLAKAYMDEANKQANTEEKYRLLLELAGNFGPIADIYAAMAYMGLSRIHRLSGMESEARKYARKASKYTTYGFILDGQQNVSR